MAMSKYSAKKAERTGSQIAHKLTGLRQKSAKPATSGLTLRQAAEVLRENDRRYRQIFENSDDGVSVLSREGRFVAVNPKFAELAGLAREEILGKTPELIFSRRVAKSLYRHEQALREGKAGPYEVEVPTPRGRKAFSCNAFAYFEKGVPAGVITIVRDITGEHQRKQQQEVLCQLLHDLARSRDLHTIGNYLFACVQEHLKADYGALALLENDNTELRRIAAYGVKVTDFAQERIDIRQEYTAAALALRQKQVVVIQDYPASPLVSDRLRKDYLFLQELWVVPLMNGEQMVGVLSVGYRTPQEVSPEKLRFVQLVGDEAALAIDRVRLTEQVRQREAYYRTILATTPDFIYLTDTEGNVLDTNAATLDRVGLSLEQLRHRNIKEFLAGDNPEEFIQAQAKVRNGQEVKGLEVRAKTARGEVFDYEINTVPLKKDGEVAEILGIARDITKRKHAEEALRQAHEELARGMRERAIQLARANANLKRELSEHRQTAKLIRRAKKEWETTFDDVAELILFTDSKGTILRCNQAVRRAFKTTYQDLIGRPMEEVFYGTTDSATEVFQSSQAAPVLDGKPVEARFPRLNGWFEVTRHPITSPTGRARQGAVYTVTDITERKWAEEQLRISHQQLRALSAHLLSVREEERKRVAREIHDELGHVLTSLKIDLSQLGDRLSDSSPESLQSVLLPQLRSMLNLVDTAIQSVRRIATSLRPEVLDHFGLVEAMQWLVQDVQARTGIRGKFVSALEHINLEPDRCSAVFRILQETLTNVTRHAKATRVKVSVKEEAGNLILKIVDNGRGITEGEISSPASLGLLGIRERILLLGGQFHIKGITGKGTNVDVTIPVDSGGGRRMPRTSRDTNLSHRRLAEMS